jgi:hypothetical protein
MIDVLPLTLLHQFVSEQHDSWKILGDIEKSGANKKVLDIGKEK